jgi:hypothetical protein
VAPCAHCLRRRDRAGRSTSTICMIDGRPTRTSRAPAGRRTSILPRHGELFVIVWTRASSRLFLPPCATVVADDMAIPRISAYDLEHCSSSAANQNSWHVVAGLLLVALIRRSYSSISGETMDDQNSDPLVDSSRSDPNWPRKKHGFCSCKLRYIPPPPESTYPSRL